MSDIFEDYEKRFKKPVPMPEQIEGDVVARVAKEHLDKGVPIDDNYDWWASLPNGALA